MGFCLLALLVGLSRLEVAGQSVGAFLSGLLISPADARKASARLTFADGADVRRAPRGLQPPAPRAEGFAFAPSPNFSGFWAVPQPRSLPSDAAHKPPGFTAPVNPLPQPPRGDRAGRHGLASLGPPAPTPGSDGRWGALVRQAAVVPRTDRPMPPQPRHLWVPMPPIAKAHTSFHRLAEKLSGHSRHRFWRRKLATPLPGAKQRERAAAVIARRLGARPVAELLPPIGTFKANEVLAINLTAEGLNRVREDGYQIVEHIGLPEFGLTITRLSPPESLNAIGARGRLHDLLPEGGFTLNRVYSPYRLSAGRQGAGLSTAAQEGMGCPAERCFGSALINWQAPLAACARDVKVGIVDTGFDKAHPAFAGLRYEYNEFLPEGSPKASSQHGTSVLSLLAGKVDSGTPGLIPDASYVIANAFSADAGGQPVSDTAQMLQALHWLKKSGVAVVNLSFAGPEDELVHHAVQELAKAGAIVVAAAGNDGPNAPPSYPAAYEEVIAVTAVDRNMAAYRYANRGEHIDIAAPGVDVWTAIPGRREGPQTGTSFAVPYVAAVVAVAVALPGAAPGEDALASKRRALAQLQGSIKPLAGQGRDPTFGLGLVQAPASCGALPAAVAAAPAPSASQPWAGTVRRARDPATPATTEPLVVGSWVSTVHAASAEGGVR